MWRNSPITVLVDDVRTYECANITIRTYSEAVEFFSYHRNQPIRLMLDHDLGDKRIDHTGYTLITRILEDFKCNIVSVDTVSSNPVGAANIERCLLANGYDKVGPRSFDRIDRRTEHHLVLYRGLPGAGKSTQARRDVAVLYGDDKDYYIQEADMYLIGPTGEYEFEGKKLPAAHQTCFQVVRHNLIVGGVAYVANTFTRMSEMGDYFGVLEQIKRADPHRRRTLLTINNVAPRFESVHNVPAVTMDAMRARWCDVDVDYLSATYNIDSIHINHVGYES